MKNLALRFYRQVVLHHPRFWLVFILAISALSAFHARDFHLDASADSLIMENDPALAYYRETGKRFPGGSGDVLIISYAPKDGNLFTRPALDKLDALEADLQKLPQVQSTYSLLDVPLLFSPKQTFQAVASEPRTLRDTSIDPASTKAEFTTESPMYRDFLASRDGKTAAIFVSLKRDEHYYELLDRRDALRAKARTGQLDAADRQALEAASEAFSQHLTQVQADNTQMIADVRALLVRHSEGANVFLGGLPMIASDMIGFIKSDLEVFGAAVLGILVLLLFLIFRQPRWVLIPLLCCSLSTLWVMGWLGWMDWKVTIISSNFIALLLIIDISLAVYLIVRYRELQAEFPEADTRWLVEKATLLMIRPCLCMVLAAMVGFGSLVISGIRPVIDFGWMMTIGIGVSLPVCYLLFPSLVQLLPREKQPPQLDDIALRFSKALGRFTEHYLWLPPVVGVVAAVLIGWGASFLTVENRFIDYFRHDSEIYQGMRNIDVNLGGTTPLAVVIDAPRDAPDSVSPQASAPAGEADDFDDFGGGDDNGFADPSGASETRDPLAKSWWFTPERLAQLVEIQHYLESIPASGKVLSLATTYELAEKLNGGPLSYVQLMLLTHFIPDNLKNQLVTPFISEDGRSVRLVIRVIDSDQNLNRNDLIKLIRTGLETKFHLAPEQVHLTGPMVLYNNMLQSLYNSQIKTLGIVLAVIFVILLLLFRSFKMAFIAILPNTISATSVLGLMGFLGMPLDLMAITITSITIGLAVNDSIHYIYRFYEEFPLDRDYLATMHRCHGSITTAMCYTSAMIVAGFTLLVLSNFMPTVHFGLLTSFAIIVALIANLTLLPALMVLLKPAIPEQAVVAPRSIND